MIKSLYDKFRCWSESGNIWIVSDTCFMEEGPDEDGMTPEEYVRLLSLCLAKNDTLVHLGDVGAPHHLNALPVRKVLVMGDRDSDGPALQSVFSEIYRGPLFIADRILLSHEPLYGLEDFSVNIHGHVRAPDGEQTPGHVNLASSLVRFAPLNLGDEIKAGLLSGVPNCHKYMVKKHQSMFGNRSRKTS